MVYWKDNVQHEAGTRPIRYMITHLPCTHLVLEDDIVVPFPLDLGALWRQQRVALHIASMTSQTFSQW